MTTMKNHSWFGNVIQNKCDFHVVFHWVSKLRHLTNLGGFYWPSLACELLMSLRYNYCLWRLVKDG